MARALEIQMEVLKYNKPADCTNIFYNTGFAKRGCLLTIRGSDIIKVGRGRQG